MPQTTADQSVTDMRIEDTPLPNRARRWLQAAGIRTVGELTQRTEADLLTLRNFAETSLGHVKMFLEDHGLCLAPPREEPCSTEWAEKAVNDPACPLTPREVSILKMRHGVDTDQPMTLAETGRVFGLTRERVRQIQKKAEEKVVAYITFRRG